MCDDKFDHHCRICGHTVNFEPGKRNYVIFKNKHICESCIKDLKVALDAVNDDRCAICGEVAYDSVPTGKKRICIFCVNAITTSQRRFVR